VVTHRAPEPAELTGGASATVPDDATLRAVFERTRTIAVVGLSSHPGRPSHRVAAYLQRAGYRVLPVNPNESEVLGEPAVASLAEVSEPIDLVDVFRRPAFTPDVAREAVAAGAKVLWLQLGIANAEAAEIAASGGLTVVMDSCIMVEHRRLAAKGD
jgi:predicted CoA-binding protein